MIKSFNGKTPRIAASAFVSEAAYVIGDVEIGENSSVWPGAVIRGDMGKITLGKNVVIEDNCVIHSGSPALPPVSNVTIGDNVVFGHGAMSNCKRIGNNVLISIGAIILHDVEIGDGCVIAAGCVVKEKAKIPGKSFVVGVPGVVKRQVGEDQLFWTTQGPRIYRELAEQYKKEGL
ncbi:MAG: gamma carbonic anhydrase family protein [Chloroflexi bacterium]|nr:gamma carbonic anhydrase family protein [Chloroflexota bacterium]